MPPASWRVRWLGSQERSSTHRKWDQKQGENKGRRPWKIHSAEWTGEVHSRSQVLAWSSNQHSFCGARLDGMSFELDGWSAHILTYAAPFVDCSFVLQIRILARHPRVFHKMRQEIVSAYGGGENSHCPTYEELRSLTYVHWVVKEGINLRP